MRAWRVEGRLAGDAFPLKSNHGFVRTSLFERQLIKEHASLPGLWRLISRVARPHPLAQVDLFVDAPRETHRASGFAPLPTKIMREFGSQLAMGWPEKDAQWMNNVHENRVWVRWVHGQCHW